jgi:hypothetical protein
MFKITTTSTSAVLTTVVRGQHNIPLEDISHHTDVSGKLIARSSIKFGFSWPSAHSCVD